MNVAIPIGDVVTIRANDADVKPGSRGLYLGQHPDSGNLLVDVENRGRVAFKKDEVDHVMLRIRPLAPEESPKRAGMFTHPSAGQERKPVQQDETKRTYRNSGIVKVGGKDITLTIQHADLAEALGLSRGALTSIVAASDATPRTRGTMLSYLVADIYRIHDLMEAMAEYEVTAKVAMKIMAKLAAKGNT